MLQLSSVCPMTEENLLDLLPLLESDQAFAIAFSTTSVLSWWASLQLGRANGSAEAWIFTMHPIQRENSFQKAGETSARNESEQTIGFAYVSLIDEQWFNDGQRRMEAGTYLLPSFRNKGWNLPVKSELIHNLIHVFSIEEVLFLIPTENMQAILAWRKLPPHRFYSDTGKIPSHYRKFFRRRQFESDELLSMAVVSRDEWSRYWPHVTHIKNGET